MNNISSKSNELDFFWCHRSKLEESEEMSPRDYHHATEAGSIPGGDVSNTGGSVSLTRVICHFLSILFPFRYMDQFRDVMRTLSNLLDISIRENNGTFSIVAIVKNIGKVLSQSDAVQVCQQIFALEHC